MIVARKDGMVCITCSVYFERLAKDAAQAALGLVAGLHATLTDGAGPTGSMEEIVCIGAVAMKRRVGSELCLSVGFVTNERTRLASPWGPRGI